MLKQRVITAVILILLIGSGVVLLPEVGLALMFGGLVLVAAWEWSALAGLSSVVAKIGFTLVTFMLMAGVAEYTQLLALENHSERVRDVLGLGCAWWAVALLWVKGYPGSAVIWRSTVVRILMGLLTLVPAWTALVYLRSHEHGVVLIFVMVSLVTAADIGAYFSGKAWGKAKLAPEVSPGKSWAGFWGGMITTVAVALAISIVFGDARHSLLAVIVVAFVTGLASVLGDLLESMLKREQGVKDSGRILPGHGGMMDRLDSMTAAAPVLALSLLLVGW